MTKDELLKLAKEGIANAIMGDEINDSEAAEIVDELQKYINIFKAEDWYKAEKES